MDLLQRKLIILVFLKFVCEAFCCDLSIKSERFECGKDIDTKEKCLNMNCCYEKSPSAGPKCYFRTKDAAGGPIQHSNGLCVYPENGRTENGTLLIWSSKCDSRNAVFLVSNDYPTYHIASGLCILPRNGKLTDPGDNGELYLGNNHQCTNNFLKFKIGDHGNLNYYTRKFIDVCIGGRDSLEPKENESVKLPKTLCTSNENCQHLTYVYQYKFKQSDEERTINCSTGYAIQVTWANYGALATEYPAVFDTAETYCTTKNITNIMQEKCNGRTTCRLYFAYQELFNESCHTTTVETLLVRFSCKRTTRPAAPTSVTVHAVSPTKLNVTWTEPKRDRDEINGYSICWKTSTKEGNCKNVNVSSSIAQLDNLEPSTMYFINVASHSCNGGIGNFSKTKTGMTHAGAAPVVTTSGKEQTTKAVTTQPATTGKSSEQETIGPTGDPNSNSGVGPTSVINTIAKEVTSEAVRTEPTTTIKSSEQETRSVKSGGSNDDSGGGGKAALIGAAAGGSVLIIVLTVLIILVIIRQRRSGNNNSLDEAEKRVTCQPSTSHENDTPEQISLQDMPAPSAEDKPVVKAFKAPSGDVYARPAKIKKKEAPPTQPDAYSNVKEVKEVKEEVSGILVSRFLFYVKDMNKNKNIAFQNEFKALPVGQSSSWDVAKKPMNADKNRYGNIVTYDHSRVVLSGGEDEDYINASFMSGIQPVNYIASQGPTDKTVDDFWRMVWELNSNCIICLTNVSELGRVKCFQYWPDVQTAFGNIHVQPLKTELFADYTIRHLSMKKDGVSKKVTQYHFTSWPDHGVPKYPTQLLAFRRRIKALCSEGPQPIIVHCSAGVGRTGTFIALDIVLERLNKRGEQTINIFDTIKELRVQRVNMIQTVEQYIFLHDAVLEYVLCGITEIEAGNLRTEIERLEQKELNKSLTGSEIEFNKLDSVCPSLSPEECEEALKKENKSKNRHPDIYPAESSRIVLRGRGYINATYVHGYTQALAYIATQTPLIDTINDFWMMVYEKKASVIVMLNNLKEEKMDYPQYWPNEVNQEMQYGDLLIKMVSSDTHGASISRKFSITNTNEKSCVEHMVRHVQFTAWSEEGVPSTDYNDVMTFLESVDEAQQRSENGVIIVHCSNGAHRTGTYLALTIQRERMKTEHVVDVFRCIKLLRGQRPQFVGNVHQYKFCYEAMLNFVESYKTYDNLPKTIRD